MATAYLMPQQMSIMKLTPNLVTVMKTQLCKAAAELGIEITCGTIQVCKTCAMAKAKQKNIPKEKYHEPATSDGCRVSLDIATIKKPKEGPNVTKQNWHILVDEATQLKCLSDFFQTKDGMIKPACEQFHKWRLACFPVKSTSMMELEKTRNFKKRIQSKDLKFNIEH
jgi:hypothetical protein